MQNLELRLQDPFNEMDDEAIASFKDNERGHRLCSQSSARFRERAEFDPDVCDNLIVVRMPRVPSVAKKRKTT